MSASRLAIVVDDNPPVLTLGMRRVVRDAGATAARPLRLTWEIAAAALPPPDVAASYSRDYCCGRRYPNASATPATNIHKVPGSGTPVDTTVRVNAQLASNIGHVCAT